MLKKNSVLILIVLILIQFIFFIKSPFCPDGCSEVNEIKTKIYTNIIYIFGFITFVLSIYKLIKRDRDISIFFGENIFYLVLSVFYFLFFSLLIYSKIF
jgi:hypothetical protein